MEETFWQFDVFFFVGTHVFLNNVMHRYVFVATTIYFKKNLMMTYQAYDC